MDCRISNFEATTDEQKTVRDEVENYARNVRANVEAGRNVVLFGKPGTGKDHLLVAMMRQACRAGLSVAWTDGMGLFESRRDAIDTETRERDLIKDYTTPDVLAISDPVPPFGDLTQGQAEFLFRILDRRYRSMKPTWVTGNFADGPDAAKRTASQIVDRLKHGSLTLKCDWDSYRKESA